MKFISIYNFIIFFISFSAAFILLYFERLAGIGWDYHPDSVFYIENSAEIVKRTLESGSIVNFLNNGFYFIVYLLNSNINSIIFYNIIIFSITNVLIVKVLNKFTGFNYIYLSLLLIILNPYRMHLSTACLKDTSIIFITVLAAQNLRFLVISSFVIIFFRTLGIVYLATLLFNRFKLKFWHYIILIIIILIPICFYFFDFLREYALEINETNMVFREYDHVPTFTDYGNFGIFLRAIIWPFLYLTGLFFFFSPSVYFFPILLGVLFNLVYCKLFLKSYGFLLMPYLVMMLICFFVSGFTSYLRYVTPIITIIPILVASRLKVSNLS